jgi:hypothetical protein
MRTRSQNINSQLESTDKNSYVSLLLRTISSTFLLTVVDLFSKTLSVKEAKEYVREISGGEVSYRPHENSTTAFIKIDNRTKKPVIYTGNVVRNRITLSHELGHYLSSKRVNTYNNKLFKSLTEKEFSATHTAILGSEQEAWEEASKLEPKGLTFNINKRLALNTYKYSLVMRRREDSTPEQTVVYRKRSLIRIISPVVAGVLVNLASKYVKNMTSTQRAAVTVFGASLGSVLANIFIKKYT